MNYGSWTKYGPPPMFVKFFRTQAHSFIYVSSLAVFVLTEFCVVTETTRLIKPKIFSVWPFTKNIHGLLNRSDLSFLQI